MNYETLWKCVTEENYSEELMITKNLHNKIHTFTLVSLYYTTTTTITLPVAALTMI